MYLQPKSVVHQQRRSTLRTIKIKINVKAMNHEGIHKNLFELPDRRMDIKKIRSSLQLVLLHQENFWLSSKFSIRKYIVQIFISS